MKEILDRIGLRIKNRRNSLKITQEKLSELADVDISYIGQIERGLRKPSLLVLIKVAKALDMELYELFIEEFESEKQIKDKDIKAILKIVNNLPENKKSSLAEIAKIISGI
jgi:transcriptional regulator with XRE-family HTH domain